MTWPRYCYARFYSQRATVGRHTSRTWFPVATVLGVGKRGGGGDGTPAQSIIKSVALNCCQPMWRPVRLPGARVFPGRTRDLCFVSSCIGDFPVGSQSFRGTSDRERNAYNCMIPMVGVLGVMIVRVYYWGGGRGYRR